MTANYSQLNANQKEEWRLYYTAAETINSGDVDNFDLFENYFRAVQIEDQILSDYVNKKGCLKPQEELKVYQYCLEKLAQISKSN